MANEKKSLEEVADIVAMEGIGYAVLHYMDADTIEDEELAALWTQAQETLEKIETLLEPYSPEY